MIAYRLFRERGMVTHIAPGTLYHKHDGWSVLPLDKWMRANQIRAWNPGKRNGNKAFRAGFHVFPTLADLIKYSRKMDGCYAVCKVLVTNTRPKPRSRSTVLLAKRMYISAYDWQRRQPLWRYPL